MVADTVPCSEMMAFEIEARELFGAKVALSVAEAASWSVKVASKI